MGALILGILSALGVITLIAARHEIARAWQPGDRLQAVSALAIVGGGLLAQSDFTSSPALVRQGTAVVVIAVLLLAAVTARRAPDVARLGLALRPLAAAIVLWLWLFIVDAWFMFADNPSTVLARSISGILLLVVLFAQARSPMRAHHFTAALLIVLPVIMVLLPLMNRPLGNCTIFKCSEIGVILLGPFSSGNYFGLEFAMLAGLALLTISSRRLLAFVLFVAAAGLYATNARTSLFAVAAGLVVYVIANWVFRSPRGRMDRGHPVLSVIVGFAAPVVGMILIFTARADSFSNRGLIWLLGVDAVGEHSVTGIGLDSWTALQSVGEVSYHFAHSEYMAIFFSGGFIAIALFSLWLTSVAYAGSYGQERPGKWIVLPFIFSTLGTLEVVWNPLTIDGLTWHAVALSCAVMPAAMARMTAAKDEVTLPLRAR
ncbi:O-antigen ligase family protein [Plantibacter flavus]|uniref:O-antigen ligase family protein n=1 Tax=Plantibacter flavus TaxID=150123 RepID=UPI0033960B96